MIRARTVGIFITLVRGSSSAHSSRGVHRLVVRLLVLAHINLKSPQRRSIAAIYSSTDRRHLESNVSILGISIKTL